MRSDVSSRLWGKYHVDFWPDGSLTNEQSVGELFSRRITVLSTMRSRGVYLRIYQRSLIEIFGCHIRPKEGGIYPKRDSPFESLLISPYREGHNLKPNSLPRDPEPARRQLQISCNTQPFLPLATIIFGDTVRSSLIYCSKALPKNPPLHPLPLRLTFSFKSLQEVHTD